MLGVQIQAVNKSAQLPVQSSGTRSALMAGTGATVTWDTARFEVSTVRFEAEMKSKLLVASHENEDEHHPGYSRDSIEIQYNWNGPQNIDLFSLNAVFGGFTLGPGLYDEVELHVKGLKSDAGSNPVFYLSGIYTTSSLQVRRFRVVINQDVAFKTEQDSVAVTGNGVDLVSVVQIYLDKLLAGISISSLDNAALQNDGSILVSMNSNPELYALILQNLRHDHHTYHHKEGREDDHDSEHDND